MNYNNLKSKLDRFKGEKEKNHRDLKKYLGELTHYNKEYKYYEQALELIKIAAKETQNKLQYHISDITSLVMESIFDDPYKIDVEFVERRNKTECDIKLIKDNNSIHPYEGIEGGGLDVVSFALRIASWSMQNPKSARIMILDEPFKHLNIPNPERVGEMLKEISDKLDIQIILVTHQKFLLDYADKGFLVVMKDGVSNVEEI